MAHITGHDRSQTLLFPESVDDYVGADNPVRFIDAFVDGLQEFCTGFRGLAIPMSWRVQKSGANVSLRPGVAPS